MTGPPHMESPEGFLKTTSGDKSQYKAQPACSTKTASLNLIRFARRLPFSDALTWRLQNRDIPFKDPEDIGKFQNKYERILMYKYSVK